MPSSRRPSALAHTSMLSLAVLVAGGCADSGGGYRPFDANAYAARREATIVLHEIGELSGDVYPTAAAVTYAQIRAAYEAPLVNAPATSASSLMSTLVDGHAYGQASLGSYLGAQMDAAIDLGEMATEASLTPVRDLAWAHESVEYFGLIYTYHTVYNELSLRSRSGLDRAYGAYSFVPLEDGTTIGLFANAEEREPLFSVELNAPIATLFASTRAIVAANTTGADDPVAANAQLDANVDAIDRDMLRIFAYGCRRYLERLRDVPAEEVDGNLIEGRVLWVALRAYAEYTNPSAASAVTLALYPTGEAAVSDPGLHVSYGLAYYASNAYDGTANAALAGLATITAALEAP